MTRKVFSQAGAVEVRARKQPARLPFPGPGPGGVADVTVCQGLGDIWWCHQKLLPYFDAFRYRIAVTDDAPVQTRSLDWIRLFPGVEEVTTKRVSQAEYADIWSTYYRLRDVARVWHGPFSYCCNHWLEDGVSLWDIDPGSPVAHFTLPDEAWETPYADFALFYVSGNAAVEGIRRDRKLRVWDFDGWVRLILGVWERHGLDLPVVLTGAEFDRAAIGPIRQRLGDAGLETAEVVGASPARVVRLMTAARFFIGYQSGLNILADAHGVSQLMLYFPYLRPMAHTWVRPGHRRNRFVAGFFDQTPEQVIDCPLPFLET